MLRVGEVWPEAWVLVSFIGRGQRQPAGEGEPPGPGGFGYPPATYRFAGEGGVPEYTETSALFGIALLRHLRRSGRTVKRWLVMGTAQSIWDVLIEVAPEAERAKLQTAADDVRQKVQEGRLVQADLDNWGRCLAPHLAPVEPLLRLVGTGDYEKPQGDRSGGFDIWAALDEAIYEGESIVLDITHALRHQPVMAAFMVTLLRWLKRVPRVELFYGAFELRHQSEDGSCPVVELPICNEMLEAAEAVATYHYSGNFMPLARLIKLQPDGQAQLEQVAYAEETNQPKRTAARQLIPLLQGHGPDPIQRSLARFLQQPLEWAGQQSLPRRLLLKARHAMEHSQYQKAITLLYEGFVQEGARREGIGNLAEVENRRRAVESVRRDLQAWQRPIFDKVRTLRHCVVHASPPAPDPKGDPDYKAVRDAVGAALSSASEFRRIFDEGARLLDEVAS